MLYVGKENARLGRYYVAGKPCCLVVPGSIMNHLAESNSKLLIVFLLSVPVLTECEDEYTECYYRAMAGECSGGRNNSTEVAMAALVDCRRSCKEIYKEKPLPNLIQELGGVDDLVRDVFGVEVNICSMDDGMDRVMRNSVIRHRITALRVPAWVPSFTQPGWEVMDIPKQVKIEGAFILICSQKNYLS